MRDTATLQAPGSLGACYYPAMATFKSPAKAPAPAKASSKAASKPAPKTNSSNRAGKPATRTEPEPVQDQAPARVLPHVDDEW